MKNGHAMKKELEIMIENYGLHKVTLALMQIIDEKTDCVATTWQDATFAKHWAACTPAAIELEAVTLREFGE